VSKAGKRERQKENRERAREERERLMKRDRRMKTLRSLMFVLVPILVILVVISITSSSSSDSSSSTKASDNPLCKNPVKNPTRTYAAPPATVIDPSLTYTATVCTSEGVITMALDTKNAPVAANNFVFLAGNGFYDGLTFHRASKDFVIQGGDPKGDGSGGPGYTVKGEVPTDHYPIGALAAAKTGGEPAGTMGSQFFIVTGKNGATLPNDYARFGSVTGGQSVADKIESFAPSSGDGTPTTKVTITKITIKAGNKVLTPTTTKPAATSTTKAPTSSTTKAATSTTT
jgi:peptidyl-prolyl cis-trans isomerase B (cyclophilin B)